ncbi:ADP-ribosylglycohydrolase family protein [Thermocrinis sp.]
MVDLESSFIGTIIGAALGDAIGKSVEDLTEEEVFSFYGGPIEGFVEPHPKSPAIGLKPEETSDETTISVLLLESIVERKGIDPYHFFSKLVKWRKEETKHRYPDPALLTAIDLLSSGISLEKACFYSSSVEGVLRSTVVGLFHFYNPYLSAEGGRLVCIMTHRSKEVYDVSAMLSALIASLVSGEWHLDELEERINLLSFLQEFAKYENSKKAIERVKKLLQERTSLNNAITALGNSSYVLEAFPLSLFIFLSNLDNPQKAFFEGINSYGKFGGDSDAIGYLVGSYVGAYFGLEAFNWELVEKLENSDYYISLAKKLFEIVHENKDRRMPYGL